MLIFDCQKGDDPFGLAYKSNVKTRTKVIPTSDLKPSTSSSLKKKKQKSKCSRKKLTKANKTFLRSLGFTVRKS